MPFFSLKIVIINHQIGIIPEAEFLFD